MCRPHRHRSAVGQRQCPVWNFLGIYLGHQNLANETGIISEADYSPPDISFYLALGCVLFLLCWMEAVAFVLSVERYRVVRTGLLPGATLGV